MVSRPDPPDPTHPRCSVCGTPLIGDPDDQPVHPAGPVCGECARAREFDQTLWEFDLAGEGDVW